MIRNYFKIAVRSLTRNAGYSFINITGLTIGIACSLLILLWVYDELTFNQYFSKYGRIHQVMANTKLEDKTITRGSVPLPLRDVLLQQDSRMKRAAITVEQPALFTLGEKKLIEQGLDVSEDFLKIFDFKLLQGNPETALSDLRSVVLTEGTAKALFGSEDPMGKMIQVKIENSEELKVTGIIADPPENISFNFKFLLPFSYFEATSPWVHYARNNWNNNAFQIYVELQPGADKSAVDKTISGLIMKNIKEDQDRKLFLHPMSHWRLYNKFENGVEAGGSIQYVKLFSAIAAFILCIACINFMNLSTARSEHRAKEVGIRKSVGSRRAELIFQFFGESVLISAAAFLLAVVVVEMTLPFYNSLAGKHLLINYASPLFWLFAFSLIVITGLLAGSYPAFYLSSFRPAQVLKGKITAGKRGNTPRQVMVTLQFCFSILLIIGTIVIYKQIDFLRNRDLGYDRENLLMVWSTSDIEKNFNAIKAELINSDAVTSVCKSNSPVTNIFASSPLDSWTGMQPGQHIEVTNIATEYDYTKTMGIRMLEGRDFSEKFKSDTSAIILNKTAVKTLGLNNPIGEKIGMWGSFRTVIGVMDDVLMGSASTSISPMVMTMDPTWSSTISVRLSQTDDLPAALAKVEKVFKKYNPDYAFDYRFADTEFEKKFTNLNMVSGLAGSFAGLAIFITCLGLFGMAAYTAEQRTKEIGIRKVLGASVSALLLLLTKDFSKMVIIAFLISIPISIYAVNSFLQQYELKIPVPIWVFPLTGIMTLLLTLAIVSTQALRAASANPVDSLRSE